MNRIVIAATAGWLCLAGSASGQILLEGAPEIGRTWDREIVEAFFAPGVRDDALILHDEEQIRAAWLELSEDQRNLVTADCAAMAADRESLSGAAGGGIADVDISAPPESPDAQSAAEADTRMEMIQRGAVSLTTWTQLCQLVETISQ